MVSAHRGFWLDQTRDAGVLLGGEYAVLLRARYHRLYTPVEGFSVSDRLETASGRLLFAYGLLGGRIDISTSIDLYGVRFRPVDAPGRDLPPEETTGDVGDSRVGVRFALPTPSGALAASLEGFTTIPTGNPNKSFSTHNADWGGILGLSWLWGGFRSHLHMGYRINKNEDEGALLYPLFYPKLAVGEVDTDNDALILRGALEYSSGSVDLFAEVLADRLAWSEVVGEGESVLEVIPGVRVRLRRGWYLTGSAGFNLSRDDPATTTLDPPELLFPDWRVALGLHITGLLGGEDRDDDGIEDAWDECPDAPEDYDGYEDEDGCPDPDNDRDGIPDDWDKMPNDPEDYDGFEDDDGAPDLDNDGDGLPDIEDFCPDEPEDFDGYQDDDGCPEPGSPEETQVLEKPEETESLKKP